MRNCAHSVLAGLLVLGWAGPLWAQDDHFAFARQRFQRGSDLYRAHDPAGALEEFRASLVLYASPNTRLFVARCLRDLGRLPEAVEEYERTVGEARERTSNDPRYLETGQAAAVELSAIEARVGRLVLTVDPAPSGLRVRVGEREVPRAALGLSLAVTPGAVLISVEAPGVLAVHRVVQVAPGQRAAVALSPVRAPEFARAAPRRARPAALVAGPAQGGRPIRVVGWGALGLGVAAALTSGITVLLAEQQYQTLDDQCGGPCVPPREDDVRRGEAYETAAQVALAVGIGAAVTGALILLIEGSDQ